MFVFGLSSSHCESPQSKFVAWSIRDIYDISLDSGEKRRKERGCVCVCVGGGGGEREKKNIKTEELIMPLTARNVPRHPHLSPHFEPEKTLSWTMQARLQSFSNWSKGMDSLCLLPCLPVDEDSCRMSCQRRNVNQALGWSRACVVGEGLLGWDRPWRWMARSTHHWRTQKWQREVIVALCKNKFFTDHSIMLRKWSNVLIAAV